MASRDDEKEFRHVSYGLIGFSRVTGNPGQLFGSSVDDHHTYIVLRISPGLRRHSLSRDWYHTDGEYNNGQPYIEIALSAVQFAELLTSMNMGSGVPCTITDLMGKQLPRAPRELLEAEQIQTDFPESTKAVSTMLRGLMTHMRSVFEKPGTVTKKDKEDLLSRIRMVMQQVDSNLPFVLKSFNEATAKLVSSAKAEIDAFVTHAVLVAGFNALKGGTVEVPQLPHNSTGEEDYHKGGT